MARTEDASQQNDTATAARELAETHYENFPVATWLLPASVRDHVKRLYAYARTVDDIGDEASGNRSEALDRWEADLRRCFDGTPDHPILKALQPTIREHDLPVEPFLRLIEANRRDQKQNRYDTWEDLLEYCTYSATPCGRLFLMVCGHREDALFELADDTCTALQLTNFWQDVGIDLEKDRIYLPRSCRESYDISADDLQRWDGDERTPDRMKDMMNDLVGRTNQLFHSGLELVKRVDDQIQFDVLLFSMGGLALLRRLKKEGYPVFERRVRLTGVERWLLFPRALWTMYVSGVDALREKIVIDPDSC